MAVGEGVEPGGIDGASGDEGVGGGAADEELGGEIAGAAVVDLDGVDEEVAEFQAVRAEPDPVRRAKRATDLLVVYQQRSTELARLRRVAIEQAARDRGMTMAAVAGEIGLSKGRITQIRQSAPSPERVLFGVGPVTVAVPARQVAERGLPVISAEDSIAAEQLTVQLVGLGFVVQQYRIPAGGRWEPVGDVVAICGPKSSPVTAEALAADPLLEFVAEGTGRFGITDRAGGRRYLSGLDDDEPTPCDVAYLGRLPYRGASIFIVAGVHAIGSVGAVHYLAGHAAEVYQAVGDGYWSAVIASTHDAGTITRSEVACPPRRH